ncbi:MAG: DUF2269 domain-containing protein [Candidatus Dormibacteraeota bacterium]|nr:DUF2269 domain-containing protein [Candidatus Dormibacteraeota bacterium]
MSWYLALKYVHVLLAIVAVGSNATYGIWGARSAQDPQHLGYTLRGIKFIDDRIANPCYIGLLLTGLLLAYVGGISYRTTWIVIAIVAWLVLAALGFGVYTPTLSHQIKTVEADGWESDAYKRLAMRGRIVGIVLAVIALGIVFDMVVKPQF